MERKVKIEERKSRAEESREGKEVKKKPNTAKGELERGRKKEIKIYTTSVISSKIHTFQKRIQNCPSTLRSRYKQLFVF